MAPYRWVYGIGKEGVGKGKLKIRVDLLFIRFDLASIISIVVETLR